MFKVAAVQMNPISGQTETNLQQAILMAEQAAQEGANLIVLPELWKTGYHLKKDEFEQLAETPNGETVRLFQELARKWSTVIVLPFAEKEEDRLYISLAVIEQTGELAATYRKSFVWGKEKNSFLPGERVYNVISTSLGKIGVLICYDIEFPEPARLLALQGAELIVVPSVWSFGAETRWDIQLPARALDNTVFILGVNTVGEGSCGKSKLVAPNGEVLCEAPREEACVLLHDIDPSLILQTRAYIPYLADYDETLIPGGQTNKIAYESF
ncbi:nitrilase-related carbon-nitrogen hydrolase [Brevibacillus sp. H7]|uniref:nitrilase-related carbon-nitrogen hydrolase n=1 Tax=Brevibacillus sp. H7 TaxID=3349138 RepID=UPI0038214F3E